nr:DUF5011 domain-containing protein [Campylobacterota bacterium]
MSDKKIVGIFLLAMLFSVTLFAQKCTIDNNYKTYKHYFKKYQYKQSIHLDIHNDEEVYEKIEAFVKSLNKQDEDIYVIKRVINRYKADQIFVIVKQKSKHKKKRFQRKKIVYVIDKSWNSAPKIKLKGDAVVCVTVGEKFVDPGVRAKDREDGRLKQYVEIEGGPVDTSINATYTLVYSVVDSEGLRCSVKRTVIVGSGEISTTPPIAIANQQFELQENLPAGTIIGTLQYQNGGEPITKIETDGVFEIDRVGNIKTLIAFDYETVSSYSVNYRLFNTIGDANASFTVNIIDNRVETWHTPSTAEAEKFIHYLTTCAQGDNDASTFTYNEAEEIYQNAYDPSTGIFRYENNLLELYCHGSDMSAFTIIKEMPTTAIQFDNSEVTSLDGLHNLETVTILSFSNMPNLSVDSGLKNLKSIYWLFFTNSGEGEIDGINQLQTV